VSFSRVVLRLPGWVEELLPDPGREYPAEEAHMRLANELSRLDVGRRTGGPFGAAVFDLSTKQLVAPGVNLVTALNIPTARAEIVVIMIAARRVVGHFDLGGPGRPPYELVASSEPCAQFFGSVPWSGVRRLACGAWDENARDLGFDEGLKMPGWIPSLERHGIAVVCDVCRDEAATVLKEYAEDGA
jgi:tRNA(Arg) A34 adenosine deaminase TadA